MTINEMFDELENKMRDTYIVTLKYKYEFEEKYTIENQILVYDSKADSYVWQSDWNEGQTDVGVLGYMLLGDVDTTKVEPCEDCLSREIIIDLVKELPSANPSYSHTCDVIDRADLLYLLERLEAVKSQRPPGKWLDKKMTIKGAHGMAYGRYACSVCKKKFPNKSNYCPNCGAEMEGKDETDN